MAKLTLADLASLANETSAIDTINANGALIETAMENTLSRDGTSPNQMEADLDLNGNFILNLATPTASTHAATKAYVDSVGGSPDAAEAWAITAEDTLVPVSAGGNGTTDYSALHWAAKAEEYAAAAEGYADTYVGPAASDPSTRLDGSALVEGDLYYNTGSNALFVYNGASWDQAAASTAGFATTSGNNTWTGTNAFTNAAGITVGSDDSSDGILKAFGASTGVGGSLWLYNSADVDGTTDYWYIRAGGDGTFKLAGNNHSEPAIQVTPAGLVDLSRTSGEVVVGNNGTTRGIVSIGGAATANGGLLRLFQSADEDTTYDYWDVLADGGNLVLQNNSVVGMQLNGDGSIQIPEYGAGVLVTDANGDITADSTTYLKASGNSLTSGTGVSGVQAGTTGSITILVVESGTIKTATLAFQAYTGGGGGA